MQSVSFFPLVNSHFLFSRGRGYKILTYGWGWCGLHADCMSLEARAQPLSASPWPGTRPGWQHGRGSACLSSPRLGLLHLALFFFFQAWFLGIGFRSFVYKAKTLLTASSQLLGLFIFWVVCLPVCPRVGESRGIQFFPSTMWVPEDQTKVLRLDDKLLYMLSHLAAHPPCISDVNIHLHMLISEPLKLRCIHVATLPCIFLTLFDGITVIICLNT